MSIDHHEKILFKILGEFVKKCMRKLLVVLMLGMSLVSLSAMDIVETGLREEGAELAEATEEDVTPKQQFAEPFLKQQLHIAPEAPAREEALKPTTNEESQVTTQALTIEQVTAAKKAAQARLEQANRILQGQGESGSLSALNAARKVRIAAKKEIAEATAQLEQLKTAEAQQVAEPLETTEAGAAEPANEPTEATAGAVQQKLYEAQATPEAYEKARDAKKAADQKFRDSESNYQALRTDKNIDQASVK